MSVSLHDIAALIAGGGGAFVLLLLIIVTGMREYWVPGWTYRDLVADRDAARREADEWQRRFVEAFHAGEKLERTTDVKDQLITALLSTLRQTASTTHDGGG